jgi:hypothetical protein
LPATAINTDSIDNLPSIVSEPLDRESSFIRNLFIEPNVLQAALKAGYSEGYATGPLYNRLKSPKLQEKIREYARSHELINSVPLIMRLEHKALEYLEDKPSELPKFSAILKQKKQIAGLLSQDVVPQQAMISIGHVANMMLNVSQSTPQHVVNVVDNKDNIISVDSKLL